MNKYLTRKVELCKLKPFVESENEECIKTVLQSWLMRMSMNVHLSIRLKYSLPKRKQVTQDSPVLRSQASGNYLQVPEELVCAVFQDNSINSNSVYDGVVFILEASLTLCTCICVYAGCFFY